MVKPRGKLKVVAPGPLGELSNASRHINWKKCCLCMENGVGCICSARNPNYKIRNKGYSKLASSLHKLRPYERFRLPCGLKVEDFDDGSGLENSLISNQARWHKACAVKYTHKVKLEKLFKMLRSTSGCSEAEPPQDIAPEALSNFTVRTRSLAPAVNLKREICFICREPPTRKKPLRRCETDNIYHNVKRCAEVIGDTELLSLLITDGNVIAQEAKYHTNCLTNLNNRCRQPREKQEDRQDFIMCESLAFADLLVYMQGKMLSLENKCVFEMGQLFNMYTTRLAQLLGVQEQSINKWGKTTTLRDKILAQFPQLTEEKSGREYLLRHKRASIRANLEREDQDEVAIAGFIYIENLRKSLTDSKVSFQGNFDENCQENSIPPALLATVNMLLYGSAVSKECRATKPALTISQLILLNFHRTMPQGDIVRNKKHQEPPFPLYMALSSYGRGRNSSQIDDMHNKGISVSYNRVMEVTSQLCRLVVKRAKDEGVVCPSSLKHDIFTVTALDNIDFKSSSTTSQGEFHGTGISVFQMLDKNDVPRSRTFQTFYQDVAKGGDRSVPVLPESYAIVPDAFLPNKQPDAPGCTADIANELLVSGCPLWRAESDWLEHMNEFLNERPSDEIPNMSWAAFHAIRDKETPTIPALNELLPLFHEKSSTVAMIKHGMDIVRNLTRYLNGEQVPVMCVDQPLFTLAKQIQWTWPGIYGEEKFVVLFGPFHIEQAFLRVLGEILDSSGWVGVVANSGITTVGSAEAMLKVTHVTRARAIHQVTAAVLHALMQDAYHTHHPEGKLSLDEWIEKTADSAPTFKFWLLVLNLEILLLTFVRSLRQGNYDLYKTALKQMLPWFFVMDHYNYSRWLTVHVQDLQELELKAPHVDRQFCLGKFVVHKTSRRFSALGVDQCHEQNNARVKGSGGAVGLTHDASSLRRWTIGGPEVAKLLRSFESDDIYSDSESFNDAHHEQYPSFQKKFLEECAALKDSFLQCENPFLENKSELLVLDTRVVVEKEGVKTLYELEKKGMNMYKDFLKERLLEKSKSIYHPIKRARTMIFAFQKPSKSVVSPKTDLQLFSRLFIVAISREMDLDTFFKYENQPFPPSLSVNNALRSGTKSHLVELLEKLAPNPGNPKACQGVVFDGAALVHSSKPNPGLKTFSEYFSAQLEPLLRRTAASVGADRIDVVFDLYSEYSTKTTTRDSRGAGVRRQQLPMKGSLPKDWEDYLRNSFNKQELFRFLAEKMLNEIHTPVLTNIDGLLRSSGGTRTCLNNVACEKMEEADGRIFLHVWDMVVHGATEVLVRSSDTDVVVIAVSFYFALKSLGMNEMWILYGVAKNRRYLPIHDIAEALGEAKAVALRGFHAFTGCDSVSFFATKGKKTAWRAWNDEHTEAFKCISLPSKEVPSEETLHLLEDFTVRLYGIRNAECHSVNQARKHLFGTKNRPLALCPPTAAALLQHARRAAYQGGQLWGRAISVDHESLPVPEGWGWTLRGGQYQPHWSHLDDVWSSCRALDRCGCSTGCSTQMCGCRRSGFTCTLNCKVCKGECCNLR